MSRWVVSRARRWVAGVLVVGAVLLGVVVGTGTTSGAAGPGTSGAPRRTHQVDGLEMDVEVGFGGWIAPGRTYPVFVTLTAPDRFQGTIRLYLESADGDVVLKRTVDVAGGSSERYGFVTPPAVATGILPFQIRVRDEEGAAVIDEPVELAANNDTELVGMLPDVAARHSAPEDWVWPAVGEAGIARTLPVAPEVLALGVGALDPLDQIVTTAAELDDLPGEHRSAVLAWVDSGGELLVVGDLAAATVLPEEWTPPAGGSIRAGLGAVRSVGENWLQVLAPSPTQTAAEEDALADTLMPSGSVELPLARRARAELSSFGGLGIMLVAYVLVVGPLAFFATRRLRRGQLAWAVVPVLALGSTGGLLVGGGDLRQEVGSVHVTVYETSPAGAQATTWSLLAADDGGGRYVSAQLPAGWGASPPSGGFDDFSVGWPGTLQIEPGADGGVARIRSTSGAYGLIKSHGTVPDLADALVVTARSEVDGEVVGTVRNQLDVPLDHVVALVGRSGAVEVGRLMPGEEREFTISGVTDFRWGEPPEVHMLPQAPWENGFDPDIPVARVLVEADDGGIAIGAAEAEPEIVIEVTPLDEVPPDAPPPPPLPGNEEGPAEPVGPAQRAEPAEPAEDNDNEDDDESEDIDGGDDDSVLRSAWFEMLWENGWNYRPIGQVVAVGWTDRLPAPVAVGDGAAATTDELSAVVGRATVAPAGDRLTDASVVRSYLRGPVEEMIRLPGRPERSPEENAADMTAGMLGILYGFEVPATVGERPVDLGRLTLGMPDRFDSAEIWTPGGWVTLQLPEPGAGQAAVPLPPDALVGGRVFVRVAVPFGSTQPGHELVLYERPNDTEGQ